MAAAVRGLAARGAGVLVLAWLATAQGQPKDDDPPDVPRRLINPWIYEKDGKKQVAPHDSTGGLDPDGGVRLVGRFCALLTLDWLRSIRPVGEPPTYLVNPSFSFMSYPASQAEARASTAVGLGTCVPKAAVIQSQLKPALTSTTTAAELGTKIAAGYAAGTRIWIGAAPLKPPADPELDDELDEAFTSAPADELDLVADIGLAFAVFIVDETELWFYDPDRGEAQRVKRSEFATYARTAAGLVFGTDPAPFQYTLVVVNP